MDGRADAGALLNLTQPKAASLLTLFGFRRWRPFFQPARRKERSIVPNTFATLMGQALGLCEREPPPACCADWQRSWVEKWPQPCGFRL